MKMKVTQKGVYDAKGQRIDVGTIIDVKGDKVPGYLVGKSAPVDAVAVTNTDDGLDRDALKAQAKEMGIEFAQNIPTAKLKELVDAEVAKKATA